MRLVAFVCCVVATAPGCHLPKFGRYSDACPPNAGAPGGMSGGPGQAGPDGQGCGPGAACGPAGAAGPGVSCGPFSRGHQGQPCPPPCREVKAPPVREVQAPAPTREVTETRETASAIAPDILLIPKTVLVPYAPHVPTGPVRVAATTPVTRVVHTEERVTTPVREVTAPAPCPPNQLNDVLEQCLQQMKMLNQRITDLEARAGAGGRPVPCPPAYQPLPCPPSGLVCPPVVPPGVVPLHPPRPVGPEGPVPMTQPLPAPNPVPSGAWQPAGSN